MKNWMPDTLFARLFLLLFVMLTISHFISLGVFVNFFLPPDVVPRRMRNPSHQPYIFGIHGLKLLEFFIRLTAIAVVSWIAARWLSLPIKRMAQAASQLGENLDHPKLDERNGPIEVRQASVLFNQMQERIKRQMSERSRFLAAVSHDLRTPLTRLKLRAEKLQPESLKSDMRNDIDEMTAMIDATLDYLRGDLKPEALCMLDVEALVHSMAEDAAERGESVVVTGNASPILLQPRAFQRCLNNLLENAIRYGERAHIHLQDHTNQLLITIRDEGRGIPEHLLETVLSPFQRLEESRNRHTGGVGLGLSIAHEIMKKMGGSLTLSNAPQGGLIATLILPRAESTT